MDNDDLTVLTLKQKSDFVQTPAVQSLANRAFAYLRAGYPVHFSGPAGTGKTTLAMHVAAKLGRPVLLIHGDDEFGTPTWSAASSASVHRGSWTTSFTRWSRPRRTSPRHGSTTVSQALASTASP